MKFHSDTYTPRLPFQALKNDEEVLRTTQNIAQHLVDCINVKGAEHIISGVGDDSLPFSSLALKARLLVCRAVKENGKSKLRPVYDGCAAGNVFINSIYGPLKKRVMANSNPSIMLDMDPSLMVLGLFLLLLVLTLLTLTLTRWTKHVFTNWERKRTERTFLCSTLMTIKFILQRLQLLVTTSKRF